MTENPALAALEAYRRANPRKADAVDEAMARGPIEDSEEVEAAQPAAGEPDPEASSEQLALTAGGHCQRCGGSRLLWNHETGESTPCSACSAGDDGGEPPPPVGVAHANGDGHDDLSRFAAYADAARALIPEGKVSWRGSPFGWMLHNGPRTKSKLGRDIVREWLRDTGKPWHESEDGVSHFAIGGQAVVVHLSTLGKAGKLEFANLREPGLGADLLLLVGVEPRRARIWAVRPESVRELHSYANDADGYHNFSLDPDDPPAWMIERARWDG